MPTVCEALNRHLSGLFSCSDLDGYVRVRTPFLYPDGDIIDLFVSTHDGHSTITDLGETLRWLRSQTISAKLTKKQRQLIEDVRLNHGVEFYRGMLAVRVNDQAEFAPSIFRLAQAALRVADLWFTFRTRSVESVTDEVEDYLSERHISYDREEKIPGRSGRVWRPDFHVRHEATSSLIYVLSTGSKAAAKSITDHVVTSWFDLSHLKIGPSSLKFISLVDDTADVWSEENIRLVGELSDVAYWSRPETLFERIAA